MSQTGMNKTRFYEIDGLRDVAVLLVLLFHYTFRHQESVLACGKSIMDNFIVCFVFAETYQVLCVVAK